MLTQPTRFCYVGPTHRALKCHVGLPPPGLLGLRPHWPAPVGSEQKYSPTLGKVAPSVFVNGKQLQGPAAAHGNIGAFFSVFCSATNDCVVHLGVHRYRRLLR